MSGPTDRRQPETSAAEPPRSFESALAVLQQIVHELEEGNLGLEASLARFEEGIHLLRSCHQILEQAEQRIEILTGTDAAGNPQLAPFDATATLEAGEKLAARPGRRRAAPASEPRPVERTAPPVERPVAPPDRDGQLF